MRFFKRVSRLAASIGAVSALAAFPLAASAAQAFPSKTVTLIVPYSPGGITDVFGRKLAGRLAEQWGQSVIVENKPGASEAVAASLVARSEPDGHTLFIGGDAAFIVNELRGPTQYDTDKDFDLIMRLSEGFGFLVVRPDLKISTLTELVDRAKSPAGPVVYGSEAVGSPAEFRMAQIMKQTPGARFEHIPYKGMTAVIQDLVGMRTEAAWLPPHLAKPLIDSGKVVAVATYGNERNWMYPEVKTLQEYGYKDADFAFKMMLVAPKGLPASVREKINRDVKALLDDKAFAQDALIVNGYSPVGGTPEEFADYIKRARQTYRSVLAP